MDGLAVECGLDYRIDVVDGTMLLTLDDVPEPGKTITISGPVEHFLKMASVIQFKATLSHTSGRA